MKTITVIGAGQMGSAICFPAAENGTEIRLVGTMLDSEIIEELKRTDEHINLKRKLPDGIKYYQIDELDSAFDGAELIISGVSSFGVDWFAEKILPALPDKTPVLSVTKGMVNLPDGGLLSYPGFYAKAKPQGDYYAVGGPCTSYELADRDQTHVGVCGKNVNVLREIKKTFETGYYHISLTNDIEGLEFAVAIKNAYALAVTLAVGISNKRDGNIHYNSQAALFGQSIREMTKLFTVFGYDESNFVYGAGDLYVTVFGGRTRKIGTLLGEGMPFETAMETLKGVTLESVVIANRTAKAVRDKIKDGKAGECDFPLLLHVDELLNDKKTVNIPWESFTTECFQ